MKLTSRQSMGAAALIMGASVFLSRIMGLVRDKVISWQFGAGADTDVYFAAFVVPDFINYLLAGGYVSMTLIPLLSGAFAKNEDEGWNFFSCVIVWNSLAAGLFIALAWIFAPQLARFTMPGFDAAQLERLTLYLRIILPGQLFFLTGSCLTAILYIRKTFTVPALTPLAYNGCIIAGGLLWPLLAGQTGGMTGYAVGASLGALCGAFLLPLFAVSRRESGGLHFWPKLWNPLLKRYVLLALPLMIGQSVVVLDEQLVRVFGGLAGEGVVSQLNYARRIMLVPVGVVAQAAGVASFPFLASLAAAADREAFDATLKKALSQGLLVMVPVTAWMIAAAEPILGLIFEGGRFSAQDTAASGLLLRILLLALPFWLIQQVLGRAFYAWQDTSSPAVLGTVATVLALPLYALITPHGGATAVAAISAASIAVYAVILSGWWLRRHGAGALSGLLHPVVHCLILSVVAGMAACGADALLRAFLPVDVLHTMLSSTLPGGAPLMVNLLTYCLCLAVSLAAFVAVYGGLALLFFRQGLAVIRR